MCYLELALSPGVSQVKSRLRRSFCAVETERKRNNLRGAMADIMPASPLLGSPAGTGLT